MRTMETPTPSPDSLADLTIADFLARLASDAPTPGGGSVAALTGALAAGLGRMVAAFTLGKPKFAPVDADVRGIDERLARAADMLRRLMDEDASAYGVLNTALKLPKADPERAAQVQSAARLAAGVPLETAIIAARVRQDVERLADIGNQYLRSDALAAAHLAAAALASAAENVRANLPLLSPDDAKAIAAQLDHVTEK